MSHDVMWWDIVRHDTEGYDLALLSFSIGDCLDVLTDCLLMWQCVTWCDNVWHDVTIGHLVWQYVTWCDNMSHDVTICHMMWCEEKLMMWRDMTRLAIVVTGKDTEVGKARVLAMTKDVSLTERRKGQIEGNQYSVHDKEPSVWSIIQLWESPSSRSTKIGRGSNHSWQILIYILIRD